MNCGNRDFQQCFRVNVAQVNKLSFRSLCRCSFFLMMMMMTLLLVAIVFDVVAVATSLQFSTMDEWGDNHCTRGVIAGNCIALFDWLRVQVIVRSGLLLLLLSVLELMPPPSERSKTLDQPAEPRVSVGRSLASSFVPSFRRSFALPVVNVQGQRVAVYIFIMITAMKWI